MSFSANQVSRQFLISLFFKMYHPNYFRYQYICKSFYALSQQNGPWKKKRKKKKELTPRIK